MEFDFSRLRGRIVEKFGSCRAFAKAIGLSAAALSSRLSCTTYFESDEIQRMIQPDYLDIPAEEIHSYFFTRKFDK